MHFLCWCQIILFMLSTDILTCIVLFMYFFIYIYFYELILFIHGKVKKFPCDPLTFCLFRVPFRIISESSENCIIKSFFCHELILCLGEFIFITFFRTFSLIFIFILNLCIIWLYLWGPTQPEYWRVSHPLPILSWWLIFFVIRNPSQFFFEIKIKFLWL